MHQRCSLLHLFLRAWYETFCGVCARPLEYRIHPALVPRCYVSRRRQPSQESGIGRQHRMAETLCDRLTHANRQQREHRDEAANGCLEAKLPSESPWHTNDLVRFGPAITSSHDCLPSRQHTNDRPAYRYGLDHSAGWSPAHLRHAHYQSAVHQLSHRPPGWSGALGCKWESWGKF